MCFPFTQSRISVSAGKLTESSARQEEGEGQTEEEKERREAAVSRGFILGSFQRCSDTVLHQDRLPDTP